MQNNLKDFGADIAEQGPDEEHETPAILVKQGGRTQSPSSINTYKQCPRKYYYSYIEKLPQSPSIHLTRGKIMHSIVEDFFNINPEALPEMHYQQNLMILVTDMLQKKWKENEAELGKLGLAHDQLEFYFEESNVMVQMWVHDLIKKIQRHREKGLPFVQAFERVRPAQIEGFYKSAAYNVLGYVDAIFDRDGAIDIIDYKTSKKDEITKEYELQLAIYAMMYAEKHGAKPARVGIHFFKFGERFLDVSDEMIAAAKLEVRQIHELTATKDIKDYPRKTSALCKWASGKCDFYDTCFGRDKLVQ